MKDPVLSASQVSSYGTQEFGGGDEGCPRLWGLKYLAGLPDPPRSASEYGKNVHHKLELWERDGILPNGGKPEDKLALAMLKHLPPPLTPEEREQQSKRLRVELPFDDYDINGVKYRGFKDLVWYDGTKLVVTDYKTTSGLQWAKDPDTLRNNTQAILYARHGFSEADEVDLFWLYGTRETTPRVLPVRFSITFPEVVKALEPITATGKRILQLYKEKPDPNTLPTNLDRCDALGGCPFKNNGCSITAVDRVRAKQRQFNKKEEKLMGWRDRVKPSDEKEVIDTVGTPVESAKPSMRERLAGAGTDVVPPPFEKSIQAQADADQAEHAANVEDEAPKTKRRGRQPGSKNKPKDAVTTALEAVAVLAEEHDNRPFILCVNTFPDGPYTRFSQFLEPVLESVRLEQGVADFRQIDFKGNGILGAALFTYLTDHPFTGTMLVDARSDEGRACLPTLERFATPGLVYRGF